jgi:glycosyltransferase involved in cell wall biosynthesis
MNVGLVSVIIPTYNRADLCKRAVESVLFQTYPQLEIIVVDDGSIDNTKGVLEGMDSRVHYLYQKNQGVSAARNYGLDRANGDFIALLDSDDEWLPWKLECQLEVLKKFPDAGMVWTDMSAVNHQGETLFDFYLTKMYGGYTHFDREKNFQVQDKLGCVWEGCPPQMKDRKCYAGNIFDWMFLGNLVHTSTVLLRRDRLNRVGRFNLDLKKSGEDYDFHLRTSLIGDVAYIDVSSIKYRIGAADQLTTPEHMVWIARNDLLTITSALEKKVPLSLSKSMIKYRFAKSHSWIGREEYDVDRRSARHHLLMSIRYHPLQMKIILLYIFSFMPTSFINFARRMKRLFLSRQGMHSA